MDGLDKAHLAGDGVGFTPHADVIRNFVRLSEKQPLQGDKWYLVPLRFWRQLLAVQDENDWASLGQIDCSAIADAHGNLFAEETEENAVFPVSPELWAEMAAVFGVSGQPVVRNMLIVDGKAEVEKFPPFFVLHVISEQSHRRGLQKLFSLSQTATFGELVDLVSGQLKVRGPIRVWFVSANSEDLSPQILPQQFLDIEHKKLVLPLLFPASLHSQGVRLSRLHVVAETSEKGNFPLDLYVFGNSDAELALSAGGKCGLNNLGNTCYMNSALQCLVHLPELNNYFLYDLHLRELNRANPLGYKGDIAVAFSGLLHKLFGPAARGPVNPRDFKYTAGRHSSVFHGYQQQDSQEFVLWLLDALHEDLNRIQNKPYCEKPELKDEDVGNSDAIRRLAELCWEQYKRRNDSVIVDLFTGMYQLTLVCPDCEKTSMTFDPFNDITLPLPVNKKWYHKLTVISEEHGVKKLEVELNKTATFDDLLAYIATFLKVDPLSVFVFEIFRGFFYRNFHESRSQYRFLPISELISDGDAIVAYIIPHDPASQIIVPVLNIVQEDPLYRVSESFGLPLFAVFSKDETKSFGTIRHKLEHTVKILTNGDIEAQYDAIRRKPEDGRFRAADFPEITITLNSANSANSDVPDDTVMVEDDSSSTTSDSLAISLAHPDVDADFGFEIRYSTDESKFRRRFPDSTQQPGPHIPRGRPQLNNLPVLASKLPEIKQKYYHYGRHVREQQKHDDYVMVEQPTADADSGSTEAMDAGRAEPTAGPVPSSSEETKHDEMDDDLESDTNWDSVQPLFESVLDPPAQRDALVDAQSPTGGAAEKGNSANSANSGISEIIDDRTTLVCQWDPAVYRQFFGDELLRAWEHPETIPNPQLEENKRRLAAQQKSTISLYDCLRNFSTPEVLGDQDLWYCPRCKEHKRATKTIQIWSTGDILAIHLKRFLSARAFSDKISMTVDFPIEGLEMQEFVQENNGPLIYDLVAVDNHYGGLGGGHYTASAKNFRDGKWYYFNDSGVSELKDPRDCITGAAYLLFYKKRTHTETAGGQFVEALLAEGRAAHLAKIQKEQELRADVRLQILASTAETKKADSSENSENSDSERAAENSDSELSEDLYEDAPKSVKKSRSPVTEQLKFDNQRKQRLISKDSDLPRSVNMYSSSVLNLASPAGSEEE